MDNFQLCSTCVKGKLQTMFRQSDSLVCRSGHRSSSSFEKTAPFCPASALSDWLHVPSDSQSRPLYSIKKEERMRRLELLR